MYYTKSVETTSFKYNEVQISLYNNKRKAAANISIRQMLSSEGVSIGREGRKGRLSWFLFR